MYIEFQCHITFISLECLLFLKSKFNFPDWHYFCPDFNCIHLEGQIFKYVFIIDFWNILFEIWVIH